MISSAGRILLLLFLRKLSLPVERETPGSVFLGLDTLFLYFGALFK